jgi:uncharacterized OB-fold protein
MNQRIQTEIPPVAEGIFTLPSDDKARPSLLGGFCERCGRFFFPSSRYCRGCLGPLTEASLGSEGTLYAFTVIRTKPPLGLPQPYAVAYVDLKDVDLRIFSLLDPNAIEKLRIGLPVVLEVAPMGHDGRGSPCLRPYFTPRSEK